MARGGDGARDAYDSPWKEALEVFFEPFVAFFFAEAHADIDWTAGYAFLDKELEQVVREADAGAGRVDKLVKVRRHSGRPVWVFVHVEVQAQRDSTFAKRMHRYHYRPLDRYGGQVVSLAILADDEPSWRPHRYGYAMWGCELRFSFPTVKLLDYQQRHTALEHSDNPFATVVMAHLATQTTRDNPPRRARFKLELVNRLYAAGMPRETVLQLLRLIDWLLWLPDGLEREHRRQLQSLEEAQQMPYVTSYERLARAEGKAEGKVEGKAEAVAKLVRRRLGRLPRGLSTKLAALDAEALDALFDQILDADTPKALRALLAALPRGPGDKVTVA